MPNLLDLDRIAPGWKKILSAVNSVRELHGGSTQTSVYNVHIFRRVSQSALFTGPFQSMFYLESIRHVCNTEIFLIRPHKMRQLMAWQPCRTPWSFSIIKHTRILSILSCHKRCLVSSCLPARLEDNTFTKSRHFKS